MAGMEGLGRLYNLAGSVGGASAANAAAISLRDCSGVTLYLNGADTYTITASTSFAGSYVSTDITGLITKKYTNTAADGTAAWVKATQSASNAVVVASGVAVIDIFGSMLPDNYDYIKCTVTGTTGLVFAILHDLTVQRAPATLAKISA